MANAKSASLYSITRLYLLVWVWFEPPAPPVELFIPLISTMSLNTPNFFGLPPVAPWIGGDVAVAGFSFGARSRQFMMIVSTPVAVASRIVASVPSVLPARIVLLDRPEYAPGPT